MFRQLRPIYNWNCVCGVEKNWMWLIHADMTICDMRETICLLWSWLPSRCVWWSRRSMSCSTDFVKKLLATNFWRLPRAAISSVFMPYNGIFTTKLTESSIFVSSVSKIPVAKSRKSLFSSLWWNEFMMKLPIWLCRARKETGESMASRLLAHIDEKKAICANDKKNWDDMKYISKV